MWRLLWMAMVVGLNNVDWLLFGEDIVLVPKLSNMSCRLALKKNPSLSVWAFGRDNWARPASEVDFDAIAAIGITSVELEGNASIGRAVGIYRGRVVRDFATGNQQC